MSTNSKITMGAFIGAILVAIALWLHFGNGGEVNVPPVVQSVSVPAKPAVAAPSPMAPVAQAPRGQIAPPKLPPAQVDVKSVQSTDGSVSTPALIAAPPTPEDAKSMKNNLRMLGSAAQQYMGEHRVREASYYDLVGSGTDNYIRSVTPVVGEDYTGIVVHETDTQVEVVAPGGTSVTWDM